MSRPCRSNGPHWRGQHGGGLGHARLPQRLAGVLVTGLLLIAPLGCAVTDGGYAYDGSVGIGLGYDGPDYYEPYGFNYGGWGPGYGVGPYRHGGHPREHGGGDVPGHGGGNVPGHGYRSAPPSRSIPSIPSRSGGGRGSGGGHR